MKKENKLGKVAKAVDFAVRIALLVGIIVVFIIQITPADSRTIVVENMSASDTVSNDNINNDVILTISETEVFSEKSSNTENGKININMATAHELRKIDGIGETKAAAIIEYREEHGPFSSVDDLVNVSGIGEKTVEKIRNMITV